MIDWKRFADMNGLTPEQFRKEIYMSMVAMADMQIDESEHNGIAFSMGVKDYKVRVIVERITDPDQ